MAEERILYAEDGAVVTITLNRPETHNAFDEAMIASLHAAFEKAGADGTVRAVVLRGAGKSFCAGGDLNWMRRAAEYSFDRNVEDAMALARLLRTVNELPKPVIALVQGNAFGGGVGLAACCDIVVAEEGARFCLSEVKVGLIPSVIAPYVLRAIGERQARRYFLTAEPIDAATAKSIGLAHEICASGGGAGVVQKILENLRDGAPFAQAEGKKLILEISGQKVNDGLIKLTAERIAYARESSEGKEGVSAFLNKTDPSWRKSKS